MASQTESTPRPSPISPRWLWALRVATALFAVVGVLPLLSLLDSDVMDTFFAYAPLLAAYGMILWLLRTNPPKKLGLAIALGMGGVIFGLSALSFWLNPAAVGKFISGIIALSAAAYSACAMRVYYLITREKYDKRTLFGGWALVGLLIIFLAIVIPNLLGSRRYAAGFSVVAGLQRINTAEINYSLTFDKGYSTSLRELGPPAEGDQPSASAAGLIDSVLATGTKGYYVLTYTPGPRDAKGRITSYTLTARTLKYEGDDKNYYSDQTGVIRFTQEDRPATAADPPIGG